MNKFIIPALATALLAGNAYAQDESYQPDFLELDGTESLQFIPDPEYSLAQGGTIEFWVEPDWSEDPGYDPVIISNSGEDGISYLIAMLRDRDGLGVVSGENEGFIPFDFTDGKVHHVALNAYEDALIVFIDGEPQGVADFGIADVQSSTVWIGSADGETAPFTGALAALRIWGVPVEKEALADYRTLDVFSEYNEPHPDIDFLQAISDFENKDILTIEGEFAEDTNQTSAE